MVVKKKKNNDFLTLDKYCISDLAFADRVIKHTKNSSTPNKFQDFVYLDDQNERMQQCKVFMRKTHGIQNDIKDESIEKQMFLNLLYTCLNDNREMDKYSKCVKSGRPRGRYWER